MNYIGSKLKLSQFLFESIEIALQKNNAKPLKDSIFCDIFAGTSIVGKIFKNKVKQVISNDREFYSFVLAKNYIQNSNNLKNIENLLSYLNDEVKTPLIESKIYKHYSRW